MCNLRQEDAVTHDPLCKGDEIEYACMCPLIARVRAETRRAIVDGLKAALPESDTRDSAVAIAMFAVSAT